MTTVGKNERTLKDGTKQYRVQYSYRRFGKKYKSQTAWFDSLEEAKTAAAKLKDQRENGIEKKNNTIEVAPNEIIYELTGAELLLAELIWNQERSITTADLMELCNQKGYTWKRTTISTLLKRMRNKGVFSLRNHIITANVSKQEYERRKVDKKSIMFVPSHFTNFINQFRVLSDEDLDAMQEIINQLKKGNKGK